LFIYGYNHQFIFFKLTDYGSIPMRFRQAVMTIPATRKIAELAGFLIFALKVQKAESDDLNFPCDSGGIAIPPARLRFRVHGDLNRDYFLKNGETIANDLRNLTKIAGREWSSFSDILDFGCGPARVLRFFLAQDHGQKYSGTDIDKESIDWCKKNISGADWMVNPPLPPTGYPDGAFDLIFAISVFTHLDENFQDAWLPELKRITRPGAILILSVHGEPVIQKADLNPGQKEELERKGFLFVTGTTGKLKLDGLPDFYQTAYHTNEYIRQTWTEHFEIVAHIPKAINNHQDAVILRHRGNG